MTSYPPENCCYQGYKHEGTAVGRIEKIGDVEVYISEPANKSTEYGILYLTDVIGHRHINTQLIADQSAANGYFVLMPDLFDGDPVPLNCGGDFDIMQWHKWQISQRWGGTFTSKSRSNRWELLDCYAHRIQMQGKTAAAGFCFGGKYVARHLHPAEGKIDVGFTAHPSFITREELNAINGPLAIAAAETDHIFPDEKRHESETILRKVGLPWQLNVYSDVEHGFMSRGDLNSRQARFAKELAFLQAVQWFDEHLKD